MNSPSRISDTFLVFRWSPVQITSFEADYPCVIILGFTQYLQYNGRIVPEVNT